MLIRTEKTIKDFLKYKTKYKFRVIDSHVHPFDVMGVVHSNEHVGRDVVLKKNYLKPSLMERLKYGRIYNFLSEPTCNLAPQYVNKMIKESFQYISKNNLITEMQDCYVDSCCLVPIEPWSLTSSIFNNFNDSNFFILGSIDIHSIKYEDIESKIHKYKNDYNIVGIKLHPNLQNFHPQPSHNEDIICKKLSKIYSTIEKFGLYMLIHGGRTFYTNKMDYRYSKNKRSKKKGVLENFINKDGSSELFDNYKMPIVIAHLGHYGLSRYNIEKVKDIVKRHDHIFFDTAGTSPKLISIMINNIGSDKIIFGSDAIYNSMFYNLIFTYQAIKKVSGSNFLDNLYNIFEKNILNIINK